MRCLIVDDEAPARLELRQLLSAFDGIEIVGEAANVESALSLTAQHSPEAVFLDVKLRGETGFDYVSLVSEPMPHLVFVTAYNEYAVRGFECNALDYLLKPVLPERLSETLRRIRNRQPLRRRAEIDEPIFLKTGSKAQLRPWSGVQHIVSDGNYTRVFLEDDTSFLVLRPLKEWLDLAPENAFLQVHRTALVRVTAIREIRNLGENRRQIILTNGHLFPVGRTFWPGIKAHLGRA